MQLRLAAKGVFERIGQAVDELFLQLGIEIGGRVDMGLVGCYRDLMPICTECGNANFCCVRPILDICDSVIGKTKFISFKFMPSYFFLLYAMGCCRMLAEWVDRKPAFEDAYKLAVVVPMPLWLVPLLLFIPSFIVNITAMAAALILSSMLIYYSVPAILKVKEKGHAILLSGSILSAGMVAWALMMYITLLTWNWISVIPAL
jgi:hypothetical protein